MSRFSMSCIGGAAALLLVSAAPAMAQFYGDGYYPPPPPPPYGYGGYGYGGYGYGGYAPVYPGVGRYYPHQETYVGPYGRAHRRCRAHRACYEGY